MTIIQSLMKFFKRNDIFNSSEKLQDYQDYLHVKEMKLKDEKSYSLEEARKELGL